MMFGTYYMKSTTMTIFNCFPLTYLALEISFMTDFNVVDDLFFNRAGLDRDQVSRVVDNALRNAEDGELFLEYRQSESMAFDGLVAGSKSSQISFEL